MSVNLAFIGGAGWQFFADNGRPLAGGLLYTYAAGTTTPLATYTDRTGGTANANPIVLDSAGRTPAQIWSTEGLLYKYVIKTSASVEIRSWDNIGGSVVASDLGANLAASSGSSLVGFIQPDTGAIATTVQAKLRESISVKDFGAVGDGVTNDTAAFAAAGAAITANNGGHLIIPAGVYIVGSQTFAGATGLGYSYQGATLIRITDCTEPVVVEFQGATLKLAAGLKYGSFDPVTGAVYNPVLPFYSTDYRADVGSMMLFQNNANVSVIGSGELDGNSSSAVLGGYWGDTGRQLVSYGLIAYGNSQLYAENLYIHHHCLDAVAIGWTGLVETSPKYPHTLVNINADYNGRQGLSVVGTNGLTVINSKFNNTGKGALASSPGAGIDLEAESTLSRNISFLNCEAINNTGAGMVADSGDTRDVTFERCKFVGTTYWSIWPKKAGIVFRDCLIVGSCVNAYTSLTTPQDSTQFHNCRFSDNVALSPTGLLYSSGFVIQFDQYPNVLLDGCFIEATRSQACLFSGNAAGSPTIRDSTIVISAGTGYIANRAQAASFQDAHIHNLTVIDAIAVDIPVDGIFIYLPGTSNLRFSGINNCISASSKIKWYSWSAGAGGASGILGNNLGTDEPRTLISLGKTGGNGLIGYYGKLSIVAFTAAPTTGTWVVGDRCINSNPSTGSPTGWICTVAGTPGTWVEEGLVNSMASGTWTPIDGSGAGLAFTVNSANYAKVGKLVTLTGSVTYPVTADVSSASIGGFPYVSTGTIPGNISYSDAALSVVAYMTGGSGNTKASLLIPGFNTTNAAMSGKSINFSVTYLTA